MTVDTATVLKRLREIAHETDEAANAARIRIARRASADGMLQSGNFYLSVKYELEALFAESISRMQGIAGRASTERQAIATLAKGGNELNSIIVRHFDETLAGQSNGAPLAEKLANTLRVDFSQRTSRILRQAEEDLPYVRETWWQRNLSHVIALAALLVSVIALFRTS